MKKKSKKFLLVKYKYLFVICLIGAILRFNGLNQDFAFSGEFGHNLLAIKNSFLSGLIPLVGPPTSHPWLSFSPIYYWVLYPLLVLFHWNPLAGAYFGAFVGVSVIFINFFVVKQIINKNVALISSLLIAISPLWILFSRDARFYFLVTPFFYFFLLYLIKFWNGDKKSLIKSTFFLGMMMAFHYTPLVLLPTLFYVLIKKKRLIDKNTILKSLGVFILPNITLLINDIQNGFQMTTKFALWIPYRFAGFLGLYPKNTTNLNKLGSTYEVIQQFVGYSFTNYKVLWPILFLIFITAMLLLYKKNYVSKLLAISFGSAVIAIYILGDAPMHYFLGIFPIPILLISISINEIFKRRIFFVVLIFVVVSMYQYNATGNRYVRLIGISKTIINDANGNLFKLKRIGLNDEFEGDFAQNYKYLMWWMGNEPVEKSNLVYTIIEEKDEVRILKNNE